jgi:serine/threonine protein kinase
LHTRITPEEVDKFQQEARLLASLKHPHIVRVLDFGIKSSHAENLIWRIFSCHMAWAGHCRSQSSYLGESTEKVDPIRQKRQITSSSMSTFQTASKKQVPYLAYHYPEAQKSSTWKIKSRSSLRRETRRKQEDQEKDKYG